MVGGATRRGRVQAVGGAHVVLGGGLGQHAQHDDGAGPRLLLGSLPVILVPVIAVSAERQRRRLPRLLPLPGGLRVLVGRLGEGGERCVGGVPAPTQPPPSTQHAPEVGSRRRRVPLGVPRSRDSPCRDSRGRAGCGSRPRRGAGRPHNARCGPHGHPWGGAGGQVWPPNL